MLPTLTPRGEGNIVPLLGEDNIALIMDSLSLSDDTSVHHHAPNSVLENEVGGHGDTIAVNTNDNPLDQSPLIVVGKLSWSWLDTLLHTETD